MTSSKVGTFGFISDNRSKGLKNYRIVAIQSDIPIMRDVQAKNLDNLRKNLIARYFPKVEFSTTAGWVKIKVYSAKNEYHGTLLILNSGQFMWETPKNKRGKSHGYEVEKSTGKFARELY